MSAFSVTMIEEAFDEIKARVKEIVPKRDLDCTEPRIDMLVAISETKHKLIGLSEHDSAYEDETFQETVVILLNALKDTILDCAAEIKGEGQDEGNYHGAKIEDIANDLIDFAEEEYGELVAPFVS